MPSLPFQNFDPTRPLRPFQDDPIGALTQSVAPFRDIPDTATRTTWSISLHAIVGKRRAKIGGVQVIAPSQSLQVDEEYEIEASADGTPRELIPQILSGRTIRLERYELYKEPLAAVFGKMGPMLMLSDQTSTLSLRLQLKKPVSSSLLGALIQDPLAGLEVHEFSGCWFTELGTTYDNQKVIVGTSATLKWTTYQQIQ